MFLRSFRLVYWGIGTSGSYTRKFGSASRLNSIRHLMGRLSDANIVYSDFPVARLEKAGVAREKYSLQITPFRVPPRLGLLI